MILTILLSLLLRLFKFVECSFVLYKILPEVREIVYNWTGTEVLVTQVKKIMGNLNIVDSWTY